MIKSFSRGWEIYYDGTEWKYVVDNTSINQVKPCKRCNKLPTPEGYDFCLGKIEGAYSACCGHGVENPYILYNIRNEFKKGGDVNNEDYN